MLNHSLQCSDVIRNLAESTEKGRLSDEMARHLGECSDCSAWSEGNASLLKTWNETKPIEPTADAWNQVWGTLSSRLDQLEAVGSRTSADVIPLRRQAVVRRRTLAIAGFALAQAAAIFLVLSFGSRQNEPNPMLADSETHKPVKIETPQIALSASFDAEVGKPILVRQEGKTLKSLELAYDGPNAAIDPGFEMIGYLESIAE